MGMFDYVICNRIMPDGKDGTGVEYQTKDLECFLWNYEITQDGRLMESHYEDGRQQPPRPYAYTGDVVFYCDQDYIATFGDGMLVALEVWDGVR